MHRDIKPSNFVMSSPGSSPEAATWLLLDFGLTKRFRAQDGSLIPARTEYHNFRGSTSYASYSAHQRQDLGESQGAASGLGLSGHARRCWQASCCAAPSQLMNMACSHKCQQKLPADTAL